MKPAFDKRLPIKWISVGNLSVVWAQSQRDYNKDHAKKIAEAFDPEMFGMLSVTLPNGKGIYHIIDGQHRKSAVEMLYGAGEQVPCEVYETRDPARAAELFDHINTSRKGPSTLDSFKVRVTAEYSDEVTVAKIVEENGYSIGRNAGENSMQCVSALLYVYRIHGAETLSTTLKTVRAIWGVDKNSTHANIIRGVGEFVAEFSHSKNLNWPKLRDSVSRRFTPGQLIATAKTSRELHGGSIATAIKRIMMTTYNRKSGKKLQEQKDDGNHS